MVINDDPKSNWFTVALFIVVLLDFMVLIILEDVSLYAWLAVAVIEAVAIISLIFAGQWYNSARSEHQELEVAGLILDHLTPDEANHVLQAISKQQLT